jgi:hypothetical protein
VTTTDTPLKLNLGAGPHPVAGFINVDKFPPADVVLDLEVTPWPWADNSVGEIRMSHCLEHLGGTSSIFLNIVKELYRVCRDGTIISIAVPHPRHDDFINGPTHVRVITPDMLSLFNKKLNKQWAEGGYANSTLGIYLDVDFEVMETRFGLEEPWQSQFSSNKITKQQLAQASRQFNNVIKQIDISWRVIKPNPAA